MPKSIQRCTKACRRTQSPNTNIGAASETKMLKTYRILGAALAIPAVLVAAITRTVVVPVSVVAADVVVAAVAVTADVVVSGIVVVPWTTAAATMTTRLHILIILQKLDARCPKTKRIPLMCWTKRLRIRVSKQEYPIKGDANLKNSICALSTKRRCMCACQCSVQVYLKINECLSYLNPVGTNIYLINHNVRLRDVEYRSRRAKAMSIEMIACCLVPVVGSSNPCCSKLRRA